ncbi:MAG: DUF1624 domain-containing protein [Hyphomicrobiales bacterium]|nr:DUF1624 domain-containing protein [Hyphomicrobiales bacterium]
MRRKGKAGGRVDAVDFARGLALIGMAAYHLIWDLADYRFVSPALPFAPPMRALSHTVASAFLLLVGVSLALAHRNRVNFPAFLRRFVVIGGAAGLVTAGSLVFAPAEAIWFGILHCIAAASLFALPMIEASATVSLAAGAIAIALPVFIHSKLFDPPFLLWIGLGEKLPDTLDWRPLLPWAGVVFFGLAAARMPGAMPRLISPKRWRAASAFSRALCFAGRHSLPIYLVHQPVLIGLVAAAHLGLGAILPTGEPDNRAFLAACGRACVAGGSSPDACASSCRCAADAIERAPQAKRLGEGPLDPAQTADLKRLVAACLDQ